MTQQPPAVSAQARLTIRHAFDRFAVTVTPDDRRDFASTELRDVREAALQIEKDLQARRSLRNLRRLQPFLQGLEHYSKSIEVLCNGTDYLPWIWAPVKLMLQISVDYLDAFEKLIEAYGKIADALPRFDQLSSALQHDHNFQAVLAFYYADILEFHRRAYKFVRRKAWKLLFLSLWGQFDCRFGSILASLSYHSDLVDKQAMSVDISEATERRKLDQVRWNEQEHTWRATKHRAIMSWLRVDDTALDDQLDELSKDCLPDSCGWFIRHPKTELWLNDYEPIPVMWLHGKPGAGKSVICSNLVQFMESQKLNVLYYFCSYLENVTDHAARLLRSLTAQAIQLDPDVAVYIHDDYLPSHPVASRRALRELLPKLFEGVGCSRIVIDGIDEWDPKEQRLLLDDILPMISTNASSYICKILVSSRDVLTVSRGLQRKGRITSLSLGEEGTSMNRSVESYIDKRLSELRDRLEELDPEGTDLPRLRLDLVRKSDGMFLWVRLVLDSLETVYSPEEILGVVTNLPSDLFDLYTHILERMCNPSDAFVCERISRILKWVCFSQRPLNKSELLHGIALAPDKTLLSGNDIPIPRILELCKPLVEERPDSTVAFVHFSVREFLLKSKTHAIVQQTKAHHDITFACTTTLTCSLDLLDPGISAPERLVRVGSGGYRLLPYALEYWTEHFLLYASTGGDLDQNHQLSQYLSAMRSKHNHLSHLIGSNGGETGFSSALASAEQFDKRLELVIHLHIYDLLRDICQGRCIAGQVPCENGKDAEEYAVRNDGTLFSKLSAEFESLVLYLLSQDRIPGLSDDQLVAFKHSYASSAYRCRYMFCSNPSPGFASPQLRERHELEHLRRVYCKFPTCQWSHIGFRNKSGLDTHLNKHHNEKSQFPIPPQVRRNISQHRPTSPPPVNSNLPKNASPGEQGWTMQSQIHLSQLSELSPDYHHGVRQYPATMPNDELNSNESHSLVDDVFSDTGNEKPVLDVGKTLADLDFGQVPERYKSQGADWLAISDPRSHSVFRITLVRMLLRLTPALSLSFDSSGRYIAIDSPRSQKEVSQIYDVESGEVCAVLHDRMIIPFESRATCICFSPMAKYLATGYENGWIHVWDWALQTIHIKLSGHNSEVICMDFARNGRLIASGGPDQTVRLWDLDNEQEIDRMIVQKGVTSVSISQDDLLLVVGTTDMEVRLWDLQTRTQIAKFPSHEWSISSVAFSPNPNPWRFLSGSYDRTVKLWSLSKRGTTYDYKCVKTLVGHKAAVISTTWTPDGSWIVSASTDKSVRFWDPATGNNQCILQFQQDMIGCIAVSSVGKLFATCDKSGKVRIWKYALSGEPRVQ